MKIAKKMFSLTLLFALLFSFNIFAMENKDYELKLPSPSSEQTNEDRSLVWKWTWLNDKTCVRFRLPENSQKEALQKQYEYGALTKWGEQVNGVPQIKVRDIYSGKWTQAADGIWSFTFDDCTIPVGVTKIDGVLYAFNTYGELKAGYEYYTGFKTEADGLVKADSAEFTQWLETQYLPECTSHE